MSTEIAVIDKKAISRLDDSLFSKDLAPHYMQLATKLASSALVPKCFQGKPQDLFISWEMGHQIGLTPAQSMQCIAVINGKPGMYGDEMLALCMVHPDFEDIHEEPIKDKNDVVTGYVCTVKRKGRTPTINTFTLDMAKKAGLLGKTGPWTTSTERMLKLRARGFSLRDSFPDALKGIKSREELEDYIDAEYSEVKVTRTETLKTQLTNKDNSFATNTEDFNITAPGETALHTLETNEIQDPQPMDSPREEESLSAENDGKILPIQPEQAKLIFKLIEEKAFNDERLEKALKYYEVEKISKLTTDKAEHFIQQLNKI